MSITEQNWTLLNSIHNEMDPPVEPVIVNEIQPEPYRAFRCDIASRRPRHKPKPRTSAAEREPRPGEISWREWIAIEIKRTGVCEALIRRKILAGGYPVKIRRVHQRLIYVSILRFHISVFARHGNTQLYLASGRLAVFRRPSRLARVRLVGVVCVGGVLGIFHGLYIALFLRLQSAHRTVLHGFRQSRQRPAAASLSR